MEIDWGRVKKRTLWDYNALLKKLNAVLSYDFVQKYYNQTMPEAIIYSERIRQGYRQNGKEPAFITEITDHFRTLDELGIKDYQDLLRRVDTKAKSVTFLQETGFRFDDLIEDLNYLFRWVLPFKCPIKELVDTMALADNTFLNLLKGQKIRSNLDALENYRTKMSRARFSRETGLAEELLFELVHRADLSRIAYVRGKTIKHLCGGGYCTLDKIAEADMAKMVSDMTAYYASIGKSYSDFQAVIPLDWMIGGARTLPRVLET